MAEQEQQPLTELDAPVDEQSRTGRAVSLARLLHLECTNLLQLYVSCPLVLLYVALKAAIRALFSVICVFNATMFWHAGLATCHDNMGLVGYIRHDTF